MERLPVTHPSADLLQAFGLGELDSASAEAVRSHLEECPECRRAQDQYATRPPSQTPSELGLPPQGIGVAATPSPYADLPLQLASHSEYEIIRELGRGGMGVVYLAYNRLMARQEVLKVVNQRVLERGGGKARFLQEIQSAAQLNHPNVVTAYSALQIGDLLVFAMQYIEGEDLAQHVKAQGPLPVATACSYCQQVALGLQHAFEKKMVHRDIKPHNLILSREGERHSVKILDFGLAKILQEKGEATRLTSTGEMLGTPNFIAPEQIQDAAHADIRADIYSLGCTLYCLLTGAPPFGRGSLYDVLEAHQRMEARLVHQVRPDVPEGLAAVAKKMMAKDPADRYQTPVEVAQALAPFVEPAAIEGFVKPSQEVLQGPSAAVREGRESTQWEQSTGPEIGSETEWGKREPAALEPSYPLYRRWPFLVGLSAAVGALVLTGVIMRLKVPATNGAAIPGVEVNSPGRAANLSLKEAAEKTVAAIDLMHQPVNELDPKQGGRPGLINSHPALRNLLGDIREIAADIGASDVKATAAETAKKSQAFDEKLKEALSFLKTMKPRRNIKPTGEANLDLQERLKEIGQWMDEGKASSAMDGLPPGS